MIFVLISLGGLQRSPLMSQNSLYQGSGYTASFLNKLQKSDSLFYSGNIGDSIGNYGLGYRIFLLYTHLYGIMRNLQSYYLKKNFNHKVSSDCQWDLGVTIINTQCGRSWLSLWNSGERQEITHRASAKDFVFIEMDNCLVKFLIYFALQTHCNTYFLGFTFILCAAQLWINSQNLSDCLFVLYTLR